MRDEDVCLCARAQVVVPAPFPYFGFETSGVLAAESTIPRLNESVVAFKVNTLCNTNGTTTMDQ